jgi:GT2 family glycosyltransferase
MPVHNAAQYLDKTLPAMLRASGAAEVVVVDDVSVDHSAAIAEKYGVRVVRLGRRGGASVARNRGVSETRAGIVVFVDADVLVGESSISRLVDRLEASGADAVFGSYDDDPPARGFFSQYANLRHHFYHQRGEVSAKSFWAGFGAMRREAFDRSGGFESRSAGVEDIAMGYRLTSLDGRIVMDPEIQVTHLKRWTMPLLLRTDMLLRALPWSRLILSGAGRATLNIDRPERLRAALAALLAVSAVLWSLGFVGWAAVAVPAFVAVAANVPLVRFFARRRGAWFAARAFAWHQFYYLYASAMFACAWFESILSRRRRSGYRPSMKTFTADQNVPDPGDAPEAGRDLRR